MTDTSDDLRATLVCLPHAGGRASTYGRWSRPLADLADVRPLDLPGRHGQMPSGLDAEPETVIADLAGQVSAFGGDPLVLFGHSMGGWLAFEVGARLAESGAEVGAVIVSGTRGPGLRSAANAHPTSGSDPTQESSAGTPKSLSAQIRERVESDAALMADLRLTRRYRGPARRTDVPVVALAGADDTVAPPHSITRWSEHTADWRGLTVVPGRHFFVFSNERLVLNVVRTVLLAVLDGARMKNTGVVDR